MSSNAISSLGALLKISDGASAPTFTAVPELRSINGPSMTSEDIDVSHLGSSGYRDFIAGFKDAGEISGEVNWTQAGYATLLALFNSAALRSMSLTFSDGTDYYFTGRVKALPITAQTGDAVRFNLTIKISGEFDETP